MSMAGQQIAIDPKTPGGVNSPYGLVLFDGVCVLCSGAQPYKLLLQSTGSITLAIERGVRT
jgi:hypothetical protein